MIETVLDNAAIDNIDSVYPVLHQDVVLIWTVLDNAAEIHSVYHVLHHQGVHMIQTVLDNAVIDNIDNADPVEEHRAIMIQTVLDNAAEMNNVYPVLQHQGVDLIQTVLGNAAKMVFAHDVKTSAYQAKTEHAEATVVVLEENVKLLLNVERASAASTCLLRKLCFNIIHTILKTSYSVVAVVKDTAWMIVVVQKDNSVQKKDDVNQ